MMNVYGLFDTNYEQIASWKTEEERGEKKEKKKKK